MFWHYVCTVIQEVTWRFSMLWKFQRSPRPRLPLLIFNGCLRCFESIKRDKNSKFSPPWKTRGGEQNSFWTSIFFIHVKRNTGKLERMKKGKGNRTTHGFFVVISVIFKNMFRQFFCHLQFWIIQSTKLNLKCVTKCWLGKTNDSNRTMYAFTMKVLN